MKNEQSSTQNSEEINEPTQTQIKLQLKEQHKDYILLLVGLTTMLVIAIVSILLELERAGSWNTLIGIEVFLFVCLQLLFIFIVGPHSAALERRTHLFLLWLQALFIVTLYLLIEFSAITILGAIWLSAVVYLYNYRQSLFILAGGLCFLSINLLLHNTFINAIVNGFMYSTFHLFIFFVFYRLRQEEELRQHTANLNRELLATKELLSQSSRQSERLRIARDLHDILGHQMTALILNLEVASHLTEGKAQKQVHQSLALGKLLLGDLRNAVSELRENASLDLRQALLKLIENIPGLNVELDFSEALVIEDVKTAETILRCVQESLTNTSRHARATKSKIKLSRIHGEVILLISDNGTINTTIVPGNGLNGMKERVCSLGGKINWEKVQGGFSLEARLPIEFIQ